MTTAIRLAALLVLAGLAVSACAGQQAGGTGASATARPTAATAAVRAGASACDLVTSADAKALLGEDLGTGELTDNLHTNSTPLNAVSGSDTLNNTCSWQATGLYVRASVEAPTTLDDLKLMEKFAGIADGYGVTTGFRSRRGEACLALGR